MQLVKKFPAFHGTRKFITALTSVRHLSLPWASPIQSIYPHPTSCISVLILSTHLRLCLHSGLFPSGFPTKTQYTPSLLTHKRHMPSPSHSSRVYHPHSIGSYHIIYHIRYMIYQSYHITSHHIIYHITSYHLSYHIISYIISYHITSYHISYHFMSFIISLHIIYHITSYHIIYHILYHITSHLIIS